MDQDTTTPYAFAALQYVKAGWDSPIPLGRPGQGYQKGAPPAGYTGWAGIVPSGPDIYSWADTHGDLNIGLHLPEGVYVLDVDAHDGKPALAAFQALALPPTWTSTSRGKDAPSRHHFYTYDPADMDGRVWLDHPGQGLDSLHLGHRYAMVWPSVHPKSGNVVEWYDPTGELWEGIPERTELTKLSTAQVHALSKEGSRLDGSAADTAEARETIGAFRKGTPCVRVANWLKAELDRLNTTKDAGALHDPGKLYTVVAYGLEGHAGVRPALARHHEAYIKARQERRGESEGMASGDWWRQVRGAVGKGLVARQGEIKAVCGCGTDEVSTESPAEAPESAPKPSRRVDLTPYLNGTYVCPEPSVGALMDGGHALLYPERWHTLVAPTASGKSWWALWHVAQEIRAGNTVVYAHFEESQPGGTLDRLRAMAPDLTIDQISDALWWLDCTARWDGAADWSANLPEKASLVVLDGINAACGQHGADVNVSETVGWYRSMFVASSIKTGAAVLSLGHPPKAKDRQGERHGFGSSQWLDLVDGVGFRLVPSLRSPVRRDRRGFADVFVVKDRYGQVERIGEIETNSDKEGWFHLGSFEVDSTPDQAMTVQMRPKALNVEGKAKDAIDNLIESIVTHLRDDGRESWESVNKLSSFLKAKGVTFRNGDLSPAVDRMVMRGEATLTDGPKNSKIGTLTDTAKGAGPVLIQFPPFDESE